MYLPPALAHTATQCFPIDLCLCRACGYVHLRDVVDPDAIYRDYIYTTATSPGLTEHFEHYARHVAARLDLPAQSLVVDIGSNDGALLRGFAKLGMRCVGVEPATKIAAQATEQGIPTLCSYFTDAAASEILARHGSASLITANNVFANIDDLIGTVEAIDRLLSPGGYFIVEFAYLADLVRNRIVDYIYHEHLSYFSLEALSGFFERQSMSIVAAERVPTKGGSLRIYVQRKDDPHPFSESLENWVKDEENLGLRDPSTYQNLAEEVAAARAECRTILDGYKAKGLRIVGYGASITCTTLVYHFGLADYLDCMIDDNARKYGTLCPGLPLVVRPSSVLYEEKPGAAIILAWRFADIIAAKHKAFLSQGGVFVIPLPSPEILRNESTLDAAA
jgi:SAM-dependent methyltransferase